jgi:2-polyprenyl-6-methoxyphenol hydroxylase-like FAD-dependent oxidoreductase
MYSLPHSAVGVWPTNDGLTMTYTAYPIWKFNDIRKNIEASFWNTIDSLPQLTDRVHNGRQADRFYGSADLPSFYRQSYGPGWVLAGDAGMTMDPITGQGIGNAFRDAERLAAAVSAGFSGSEGVEKSLSKYQKERDAETLPMYQFTSQLAAFKPPAIEQQVLFSALANQPELASRFLGVLTGSVPVQEFFSPSNLFRIMGIRGMGKILMGKLASTRKSLPSQVSQA